jgi:hypothetical protein
VEPETAGIVAYDLVDSLGLDPEHGRFFLGGRVVPSARYCFGPSWTTLPKSPARTSAGRHTRRRKCCGRRGPPAALASMSSRWGDDS